MSGDTGQYLDTYLIIMTVGREVVACGYTQDARAQKSPPQSQAYYLKFQSEDSLLQMSHCICEIYILK